MEENDKKRIAITAGILAVIVLLAVIMITWGGSDRDTLGTQETSDETVMTTAQESANDAASEATSKEETGASQSASLSDKAGEERKAVAVTVATTASGAESSNASATAGTVVKYTDGYKFFKAKDATLKSDYSNVAYDSDVELETMLTYWSDANLPAVRDLVALPRYEAISATLAGTKDYYYYGARNALGQPEGKGVAVYANNQYYYGDFVAGKRQGKGEWLQRYPVYNNYVVIEHYYTGEWAADMPNGKGQDHYEYNENKMDDSHQYLLNAIGTFKDGYYDGEMYIMIEEENGSYTEWIGNCTEGTFEVLGDPDPSGGFPVLHAYEDKDHHIWLKEERNKDFKVDNLIVP
ncbi:MAG: hypothetical protein IJR58_05685 [Lachnospiraceae bacterium]|nr:hypothetical protein [Lachnospiraceae bacterium]